MSILILAATLIWVIAFCLLLFGTRRAIRHFRSSPPFLDAPFGLYPVSILKPLKGTDPQLEKNLESFFKLDYPEYELIFSVASASDESLSVIKGLMRKYPAHKAKLIIGAGEYGPNPKVNNLVRSYEEASHDWLLISDSNVRVPKNYLKRMLAHVDSNTGIVTAVVAGRAAQGPGGHLEATYLNTFYARWMILADWVGRSCVVSKSMLLRRSAANRFGGIKTLARYLAEDYMAGEAMKMLGLKVITMSDPIEQRIGQYRFYEFWSRHLRWGRIRKAQAPMLFAIEPALGPLLSGFCGAWAAGSITGLGGEIFLLIHLGTWAWADLAMMKELEGRPLQWRSLFYWILRELLHLPLWLQTLSGNTVSWRGVKLRVLPGGILENRGTGA